MMVSHYNIYTLILDHLQTATKRARSTIETLTDCVKTCRHTVYYDGKSLLDHLQTATQGAQTPRVLIDDRDTHKLTILHAKTLNLIPPMYTFSFIDILHNLF